MSRWFTQSKGTHTEILGTATKPLILGRTGTAALPAPKIVSGTITVSGPPGEFISDGMSHRFLGDKVRIEVTQNKVAEFDLEIPGYAGSRLQRDPRGYSVDDVACDAQGNVTR